MTITLTGATGFVGQNLLEYLSSKGYEVSALSLRGKWSYPDNADAIIHLAGKAHDTANTSADDEYYKVNRDLTIQLFDDFLASDTRDFIYFSSVKAAADEVPGVLTEEQVPAPKTAYGKSKLAAEEYLLGKQLPDGKRAFIIRPCMIHGPGNKGNLNLLFQLVQKGLPWPLGAFHNERSLLSIDNLSFFIHKLLENPAVPSGIYQVADDQTLSTNEIVQIIAEISGKKPHLWNVNPALIQWAAKAGDVVGLPLNSERLRKLTESYVVSNAKIKQALGIDSLPVSATEGLQKTIKSFQK